MRRLAAFLRGATITLIALTWSVIGLAQAYPSKPIHIVVGFSPGGATDVTARLFAQKMSVQLGQPVVVENKVGAAGSIAADQVAKSPPDGYRLLMLASGTLINAVLSPRVTYNIERDFTPISLVTVSPLVLAVHPAVPANNVAELIALARSRPGQLNFGSEGIGGTSHLAGELFNHLANVKMVHVPFKAAPESTAALAGGQIEVNFPSLASATPLLNAGKFRALAVTSLKRSALNPALPTLDESGLKGYDLIAWFGFVAPAGLPVPIRDKLHAVIVSVANDPEVREAVSKQGLEVQTDSPDQFAAYMRAVAAQVTRLRKVANINLE